MNAETPSLNGHALAVTHNYSITVCDDDTPALYRETLEALTEQACPFWSAAPTRWRGIRASSASPRTWTFSSRSGTAERALDVLAGIGCRTEMTFAHWLAKGIRHDGLVDVIFGSGNGVAMVDDEWFTHSQQERICGVDVKNLPARGAPMVQGVRHGARALRRRRRAARAARAWTGAGLGAAAGALQRLLAHPLQPSRALRLRLSDGAPSDSRVGDDESSSARLATDQEDDLSKGKTCLGTLVSRQQYLPDIDREGFGDGRLVEGVMTPTEIAAWTAAIDE